MEYLTGLTGRVLETILSYARTTRSGDEEEGTETAHQATFFCCVCLEEHLEEDVACVEPCEHLFCRDSLRGYIGSKLDEHRFPIICPACVAEPEGRELTLITDSVAQQIGISEEQYQIWVELEMVQFSILLHCRKCRNSMFVDRDDYDDNAILACPICYHHWCKTCQQDTPLDGPEHSCDGSKELDNLVKNEGWKRCPGCQVPIDKYQGCNHISCTAPACNTHFCYVCGEIIIRSALMNDIMRAKTDHFKRCQLFAVPAE